MDEDVFDFTSEGISWLSSTGGDLVGWGDGADTGGSMISYTSERAGDVLVGIVVIVYSSTGDWSEFHLPIRAIGTSAIGLDVVVAIRTGD